MISALEAASDFTDEEVDCSLDSELVVKQLNRDYEVHNRVLKDLWLEVNRIKKRFRNVSFWYVRRTNLFIKQVDEMANEKLEGVENRFKPGA